MMATLVAEHLSKDFEVSFLWKHASLCSRERGNPILFPARVANPPFFLTDF
jgi:hypothetical protein